jgi:hypothetical protein
VRDEAVVVGIQEAEEAVQVLTPKVWARAGEIQWARRMVQKRWCMVLAISADWHWATAPPCTPHLARCRQP